MEKPDIHNYKRRLERTIENIKKSNISEENKATIKRFHDICMSEGMSLSKMERYLFDLSKFAIMLNKDLMQATKDEILGIVTGIEKREWSPHTKQSFKVMIKKFYKSVEGFENGVYPERVRAIKTNLKECNKKRPSDLLTETDVRRMIECAANLRDKTLIAILYESGCRIGEIGHLQIRDVVFDRYGAVLSVNGKTGSRRVRIITSSPYLQEILYT